MSTQPSAPNPRQRVRSPRWVPHTRREWLALLRWPAILLLLFAGLLYVTRMPRESYSGPLPPLAEHDQALRRRLERHVSALALEIGERNVWTPGSMLAAAAYIRQALEAAGYSVTEQPYQAAGATVSNIEAERRGTTRPDEILVIGAHYDSVPASPGADDNASAVAALIEIAASLSSVPLARTVRFVAFANEEPPFFQTEKMGSFVYAARAKAQDDGILAMLAIESVGYYSEEKNSQKYPFPFSLLYPSTGNFIGFIGNVSSRRLVRRAVQAFRDQAAFPSEGAALPGWITGVGWSDHWAFWQQGYPALMVTDTAPFRTPYYHTPGDTPDKLDFDRMTRVVAGMTQVVITMAGTHVEEAEADALTEQKWRQIRETVQ